MTGLIFDIQRFSIHDGPGIRTTVFFKGCNLRCAWCHNPESQNGKPELMFYKDKCTGCGKCEEFCEKSFTESCISCGKCAAVCKFDARQLCGREADLQEIMSTVRRDIKFYETSGGGVTFSGGEPLLQIDFLVELLKMCKSEGIHTAIETAGCVSFERFEKILPYTDLFLFDIKSLSLEKHKKFTGADNALILENARKLKEKNANILFRMPVVPEYNDDEAAAIAEFAKPKEIELMPYHSICKGKYDALGREFLTRNVQPPSAEYIDFIKNSIFHIPYFS